MKFFNQFKIILFRPAYNKSISLILVILIISSILTGTLIVGNVLIRHAKIVKGTEISDRAYFGAESVIEKATYAILKNYQDISTIFSGTLDNGTAYLIDSSTDSKTGIDLTASDNPWNVSLDAGQSFWLKLDLNGASYPTSLIIGGTSITDSELIVLQCTTTGSPPQCDNSTLSQVTYYDFPQTINLTIPTHYYKIRINNNSASSQIYSLTPNSSLPIKVTIKSCGTDSGYKRYLNSSIPKWIIF